MQQLQANINFILILKGPWNVTSELTKCFFPFNNIIEQH